MNSKHVFGLECVIWEQVISSVSQPCRNAAVGALLRMIGGKSKAKYSCNAGLNEASMLCGSRWDRICRDSF
jgi:hypothetical protein